MLIYKGNAKHKEPWQPGRKGSLCPSVKKMPGLDPQRLLNSGMSYKNKIYSVYEGIAFAAHCEGEMPNGNTLWHGFPVPWNSVPEDICNQWLKNNVVSKKQIRKLYTLQDIQECEWY
ncbi:hypothetical protein FACS1894187_20990 [Synergistales bacterium]|nr:hypothetical protein FACS1894187_20990 [Synergistales bacterium]